MSRLLPILSFGLLLVVGCKTQVVRHGRDSSPQKLRTWVTGPDQQQLANALYRAEWVSKPEVALLKQYYYLMLRSRWVSLFV